MRVNWAVGAFYQVNALGMTGAPEKRKVGSSTLPLTTIASPGWRLPSPAFSLLRGCFRLNSSRSTGVYRGVSSCPWGTRGGRPTRTCGISVGPAGGLPAAHTVGRSRTSALARGTDSRARPEWLSGCPRLVSRGLTEIACWPDSCWAVGASGHIPGAAGMLSQGEAGAGAARVSSSPDLVWRSWVTGTALGGDLMCRS